MLWLKDISDILLEWRQVSYTNLVCLILSFYLLYNVDHIHFEWTSSFTCWYNPVLYTYISIIFCQAKICMNDYFAPNYFSVKGDYFFVSLLFIEGNRWGRAPRVSLFSWCVIRLLHSNFLIFWSMRHYPTREYHGAVSSF